MPCNGLSADRGQSDATGHDPQTLNSLEGLTVQEERPDLQLSRSQAEVLCRAMDLLERGHSNLFEDELWLGFGNDWWALREKLIRNGSIRRLGGVRDELELTERGIELRRQIDVRERVAG